VHGILTEREAAAMIADLKPQTLAKWRQRKLGPAYLKLGGKIRYKVTDIEQWIERNRVDPAELPPAPRKHRRRNQRAA
jgi:helix-turn-helix protein